MRANHPSSCSPRLLPRLSSLLGQGPECSWAGCSDYSRALQPKTAFAVNSFRCTLCPPYLRQPAYLTVQNLHLESSVTPAQWGRVQFTTALLQRWSIGRVLGLVLVLLLVNMKCGSLGACVSMEDEPILQRSTGCRAVLDSRPYAAAPAIRSGR